MGGLLCFINPIGCAAGSIAKSTFAGLFNAITGWMSGSLHWLLAIVAKALTATSDAATISKAASGEFTSLLHLSPLLLLVGVLIGTLQGIRSADSSVLWRLYLGAAPLWVAGIFVARPVGELLIRIVNQLSASSVSSVSSHVSLLEKSVASLPSSTPGFGLFLLVGALITTAFLLWCELVVRMSVLTLLLALVPIIFPLSVIPATRRLGLKLIETFTAIVVSKFFIVITLLVGFREITLGNATSAIVGVVTIVLAIFSPIVLLRIIPFLENSAALGLVGLRQRATSLASNFPNSPIGKAAMLLQPLNDFAEGPPVIPEDFGLPEWDETYETQMPVYDPTIPNEPPILDNRHIRKGHRVILRDRLGPVIGWHWDD
jgi:hypothetical protein